MAGRPPAHPPGEVHLERTRARQPRARAVAAAAEQLAATAQAQQGGAKVFTLYGDPPAAAAPAVVEQPGPDEGLAVGFYRRLGGGHG